MKISRCIKTLLFEAYRRNQMRDSDMNNSIPLTERWLGLGTADKPMLETGLMQFFDGITPPRRCMGWLVLTEAGVTEMQKLQSKFAAAYEILQASPNYKRSIQANYTLASGITTTRR
jgi:hypothetical protein